MNLEQRVQTLQLFNQFITTKSLKESVYIEVAKELEKINFLIKNRRLPITIFSQVSLLAKSLSNTFQKHQTLSQFYEPTVIDLSVFDSATSNSNPTLNLQTNPQVGQPEAQYSLSVSQGILIGRDLQCQNNANLLQIPLPMYKKVSGRHAEIQSILDPTTSFTSWQICDLNSTNGTYINGRKITGCQVLNSGDNITLGYPDASEKAPGFIFEAPINVLSQQNYNSNIAEAELVFLVIHPSNELSLSEQKLVEQISKASIFGFIIVVDTSETDPSQAPSINANLASIQSWVESQFPQLANGLEIISLPLAPFYPNIPFNPLTPAVAEQFHTFATPFINLAKNQGAKLLENRISQQLQAQIQQVEEILNNQENQLKNEIQLTEASLNNRTLEYWRDHSVKVKKQIDESRDEFFREARTYFSRARDDFSTDFIPNSLVQKVDVFVNSLEPVVNRIDNSVCIQLKSENEQELHTAMIDFCQAELTAWGSQQWEQICRSVGNNGLEGLRRNAYSQLNCFPEFQLTNTFASLSSHIDFSPHFKMIFSEAQADISYNESSGDSFGGIAKSNCPIK